MALGLQRNLQLFSEIFCCQARQGFRDLSYAHDEVYGKIMRCPFGGQ